VRLLTLRRFSATGRTREVTGAHGGDVSALVASDRPAIDASTTCAKTLAVGHDPAHGDDDGLTRTGLRTDGDSRRRARAARDLSPP
jgi:hypothetical protein